MKKLLFLFAAVFMLATSSSFSQGIKFSHGKFEQALKMAKSQNKIVFVDFFTTW